MEFRTLHKEELDDWYNLCHTAFDVPVSYFKRHFNKDPNRNVDAIFVAVDNNKLVASVRVFKREIYYHGQEVKMGGIGEVCTLESHHRQGLAKNLLKKAIDYMKDNDYKVSVLGSGADKLYQGLGFKSQERLFSLLEVKGKDHFYSLDKIGEEDYLYLTNLYNKFSLKLDGSMVRSLDYFKTWFKEESALYESYKILKGHKAIGYIVYSIKDHINIHELVLEDEKLYDEILEHLQFNLSSEKPIQIPAFYESNHRLIEEISYKHWMYLNLTHEDYTDLNNHVIWKMDHY